MQGRWALLVHNENGMKLQMKSCIGNPGEELQAFEFTFDITSKAKKWAR